MSYMNNWYITSIRLKDFGIFENTYLDLSRGINNILGSNASGKSTVIQAIKLSLQLNDKKTPVNNFIRKDKTNQPKKAIVELKLNLSGKVCTVYSEFAGGNNRKIYRKVTLDNGLMLENNAANNFLTDNLGLVNLQLMFAINPKQSFISTQPSTNFKTLLEILSISFDKEIEYSKEYSKLLSDKLGLLDKDYQSTESNIKLLNANLNNTIIDIESTQKELENLQKPIKDEAIFQKELNEVFHIKESLSKQLLSIESNNEAFYKQQKEQQSFSESLANYEKEYLELSKMDLLKKSTTDIENVVKDISNQIVNLKKDLLEKNKESEKLDYSTQDLISRIKMIDTGICPICNQNTNNVKIDYSIQLDELNKTQNILKEKIKDFNSSLKELEDSKKNNQLEIEDIKNNNLAKDKVTTKLSYLNNLISLTKDNLARLNQSNLEYSDEQELQKLYQESNDKYESINNQYQAYKRLKEREIQLKSILVTKGKDVENLKKDVEILNERKSAILKEIDSNKNLKNSEIRILSLFENLSGTYLKYVASSIESIGTQLVTSFGYKGILLEISDVDKTLEVYLRKPDYDIPYKLLSGFETDLVNLAMIISLSKLLKVPCLCLDELDAHIDSTKTKRLAKLVEKLADISQILVITHNAEVSAEWFSNNKTYKMYELCGGKIVHN